MEEDDIIIDPSGAVAHNASNTQTSKYACGKNGSTGHGFAAEDANALADTLRGCDVDKVGVDNLKNGADRVCDGIKIQSKYCKTARSTINSAFDNITGEYKYRVSNGRPMKLEVPSDQYEEAINIMRSKIIDGKVKGVKNPDHASKMIRKGVVTYDQAVKISQAGTVESLIFDAKTGAVSSASAAGISAVISYIIMKKNGASNKEALITAGKQGGRAAAITMTTQVAVGQIEKLIVKKAAQKASEKAVEAGTKSLASTVLTSVAKSTMRTNIVTAAVTTAVTTIPAINKARKGEISWSECGERATSNAGSVVGGLLAAGGAVALMSNPVSLTAMAVSLVAGAGGSMLGEKATRKLTSFFKWKKR